MARFILRLAGNILALLLAVRLIDGFTVAGGLREYLIAGLVLGLLNTLVKPALKAISFPVIILTLGLFLLVINGFLVWMVDYVFDFVTISDTASLVYATILVALVNFLVWVSIKIIV